MISPNLNFELLSVVGEAGLPEMAASDTSADTALQTVYSASTFVCC